MRYRDSHLGPDERQTLRGFCYECMRINGHADGCPEGDNGAAEMDAEQREEETTTTKEELTCQEDM